MEHRLGEEPTAAERAAVDSVVGPSPARDLLLPALHALHDRVGYLSRGGVGYVCETLGVAPADAFGVATFYGRFAVEPCAPRVIEVCDDIACSVAGADGIVADLKTLPANATSRWRKVNCLGLCERAPAALVHHAGEEPYESPLAPVDSSALHVALLGAVAAPWAAAVSVPQRDDDALVLLRRAGRVDPASLADYEASGGFAVLAHARELGREGVLNRLAESGLVGRGGAAFPTARKWRAVAEQPSAPRFVVCNADESEPGTFKDRVLMENDPFAVVEAVALAAETVGSDHAFIYLRGEYPVALERLRQAIDQSAGWLGELRIEIRRGAGAYICGEETAIFNSIEGFRGEPRSKPPFPTEVGLFGKPTLVNNVETLVSALNIVGGQSRKTKLFCVSGCVTVPGVYECAPDITLRSLLALAGGVRGGRNVQAVLLGGAAGGFLAADELDTPLTLDGLRSAGASLGSGVVMVLDDQVDLRAFVSRIAAFFRDESCGQCVPCRVGTVRQEEALRRGDKVLLREVGQVMRDASICGLGQTASAAVESAIDKFGLIS